MRTPKNYWGPLTKRNHGSGILVVELWLKSTIWRKKQHPKRQIGRNWIRIRNSYLFAKKNKQSLETEGRNLDKLWFNLLKFHFILIIQRKWKFKVLIQIWAKQAKKNLSAIFFILCSEKHFFKKTAIFSIPTSKQLLKVISFCSSIFSFALK